jgi:spermidine synthase
MRSRDRALRKGQIAHFSLYLAWTMIELSNDMSEHGAVRIFRSQRRVSHIYMHGDAYQSEADCYGISLASYIHAIYGLICQMDARSVLLIGCAGGTLATMLALGDCETTAIDVNPIAFEFARRYFCLPGSVECCVADGFDYLRGAARSFDAVVLDAYDGSVIPDHLTSRQFLRLVSSSLNRGGAFFANVHMCNDADRARNALAACAADVWPNVRILDTAGDIDRNAIVAAGGVTALVTPTMHIMPQYDVEMIESELAAMEFCEVPEGLEIQL